MNTYEGVTIDAETEELLGKFVDDDNFVIQDLGKANALIRKLAEAILLDDA